MLTVQESSRAAILPNNIQLSPEYASEQTVVGDIVFRIVNSPKHGQIRLDAHSAEQQNEIVFGMADITSGRVFYVNDGEEFVSDTVGIQLELVQNGDIREKLQRYSTNST